MQESECKRRAPRSNRCGKRIFCAVFSVLIGWSAFANAAETRARRDWGTEALWGYWHFDDAYLAKRDWKIAANSSAGTPGHGPLQAIDDDSQTYFAGQGQDAYEITLDLGQSQELGALTILTTEPPNRAVDSRMARYEVRVGAELKPAGPPLAAGNFAAEEGSETVVSFPPTQGRFVTLKAYARPNANKEVVIREISLASAEVVKRFSAAGQNEAAARGAEWEHRDAPPAVEKLGREFLDLVFCNPDDIDRSNLRGRPALEHVGQLKMAGKYADGLKAFRDYYFEKLRRPQNFGIYSNDLHPYGRGYAGISEFPQGAMDKDLDAPRLKQQIAQADALLDGIATLENGTRVKIGEPGAVDWWAPAGPYGYTTKTRQMYPYRELWWGTAFHPLFTAYIATKDERYLRRWIAYMDDWAMNADFLTVMHPVVNHDNSSYPAVMTIRMFAAIAEALPYDSDAVPPAAFARIMRKLVLDAPLNWILYMRSCGNGWTPGAGPMLFAILIDEFKVAPLYFRETRRRNIEDINVLQELRDGTETHQWPGYNFLLLNNAGVLRLMDARDNLAVWGQPVWEKELHTPQWQHELTDALKRRASYMLHWGTPNGEYPLVTHQEPPNEKMGKLREAYSRLPEMLDDPTNAKLYSTLYGDGSAGVPEYTAEWFPYGGYNIARDGWKRDDGYGAMFCSPQPGCGGVGSGCKNNVFGLAAYGMDLLSDDLVHGYVHTTSPIQVDGKRQQFDFYVPKTPWPTAHRGDLITEWTEPAPWRWHASDRFNLMEGIYRGVYANDFHNRTDFVNDVAHQRLALYSRQAGIWVLTDRLLTTQEHDYEQLWWLPLKHRDDTAGFAPEEIHLDPAAKTIKTTRTRSDTWFSWDRLQDVVVKNVNLSMQQFTAAPLKYTSTTLRNGGEMYDWQRIGAAWHGAGNQQIVTVLYPRKPTGDKPRPDGSENDLAAIQALPSEPGTNAFEATTADGWHVMYAASANQNGPLKIAGIQAQGEALLAVRGPAANGALSGIALGCTRLEIGGKAVPCEQPDFEFTLPADGDLAQLKREPIYRPISPVKILPESDVFIDEQKVTLRCDTPGVVITYTLDGTEPDPHSTVYRGPFKIDATRVVKTRAYRPGVEKNPPQTSGTEATPTSYAVFTKKLASLPEDVTPHGSGLNVDYYEGNWKDLWLSFDGIKPRRSGTAGELFDLAIIPADNAPFTPRLAPREKTYLLKFTGYLRAPQDGVYTLHAPRETVHCDTVAGYELQVYLGHALNPDNRGVKREEAMNFWYPATRLHGQGTWSVPLKKGYHEFKVVYLDFRMAGPKRLNQTANLRDPVWSGEKPDLEISGPGIEKQPIPPAWLWR